MANQSRHLMTGVAPTAVILCLALATPVGAQATSSEPGASQSVAVRTLPDADEIIVTANKQKENISKVPISILAYSNESLKQSGIKSISDLGRVAPGVQFDQSSGLDNGTGTTIAIRGVYSTIGQSTTGIYLDDISIQTRVASLSYFGSPYPTLYDLSSVEVDRGPQGTLFGAGAEGGAVRFITPDPSLTTYTGNLHSEFAATQSGAPTYEGGAALGGPIIADKLGFRVSAWDRRDGGYVDRVNPFTGAIVDKNSNTINAFGGRAALLFSPSEDFRIEPAFYAKIEHVDDTSSYFSTLSNPSDGVLKNGRLSAQPNTDRFYLPSLKAEIVLPGQITLTSVSSYLMRNGEGDQNTTGVLGPIFGGYGANGGDPAYNAVPTAADQDATERVTTRVRTFNQELRLSNAPGSRLKWTAGAYYSRAVQTDTQNVPAAYYTVNFINPVYGLDLPADDPVLNSTIRSVDKQISGFGQIDYKIIPNLTVTLGARISHTTAAFSQTQAGLLSASGSDVPVTQSGKQKQNPWSGKVGLAYQLNRDDLIYASASRGFRIGGANQAIAAATCGTEAPATYGSDQVNSYELGTKGRAADGKVRFEGDVFYVQWKNIQQNIYLPCNFGYITNAGNARTKGFDLSLRFVATDNLTLNVSVSYVDAKFSKAVFLPTATPGDVGSLLVSHGDEIAGQGSAPWNITGGFDYKIVVGGHNTLFHIEDNFKSHNPGSLPSMHPLNVAYAPTIPFNPAVNQINARYTILFKRFEIAAYVNNIANSHPVMYRYVDFPESALYYARTLRPRTFGITLDYNL